jgi:hypothetical protein
MSERDRRVVNRVGLVREVRNVSHFFNNVT